MVTHLEFELLARYHKKKNPQKKGEKKKEKNREEEAGETLPSGHLLIPPGPNRRRQATPASVPKRRQRRLQHPRHRGRHAGSQALYAVQPQREFDLRPGRILRHGHVGGKQGESYLPPVQPPSLSRSDPAIDSIVEVVHSVADVRLSVPSCLTTRPRRARFRGVLVRRTWCSMRLRRP